MEVAVLGSDTRSTGAGWKWRWPSLVQILGAQELCESGGGHPWFRHSEHRSCVKVEVAILGSDTRSTGAG